MHTCSSLKMPKPMRYSSRPRSNIPPNRFRGLLGAARAAGSAGDREKASEYFGKIVDLAKNADTERREIREAKTFLARRS